MSSSLAAEESTDLRLGFANRPWLVHKFGGTSVASAECFQQVASIIEDQIESNQGCVQLAVVVSAMGGKPKVTDLLLNAVSFAADRNDTQVEATLQLVLDKHDVCLKALFSDDDDQQERLLNIIRQDIQDIRDILKTVALMKWQAKRIRELVSGYGELWSTRILTALLKQRNSSSNHHHEFCYLDARRVITIDEEAIADGAVEWEISLCKLEQVFAEESTKLNDDDKLLHFVTTGYVATNTNGVATTLQRDGSDYSAAIMGKLLSSNSISIWTDVSGVLSADPRRVPQALVLPHVSFNEAMELAYFGAKVIHPKTMQPALTANPQIPIYIRNTFQAHHPGTRIYTSSTTTNNSDTVVCGFSSVDQTALIDVEGSGLMGVPGVAKRLFGTLEQAGINVILISQASSEHSISFCTTQSKAEVARQAIEEEFQRELTQQRISSVAVRTDCSIIAAVGDGMSSSSGVAGRFFSALGDAKINVIAIAQGCSERNISAVVSSSDSSRALRAVHAAFHLSHSTIRVAILGMSALGESLLKLLEAQRETLESVFDMDVQVCVLVPSGKSDKLVCLKKDTGAEPDSISFGEYRTLMEDDADNNNNKDDNKARVVHGGVDSLLERLYRLECTRHAVFDCTNDATVAQYHATWLRAGVDVVTANNMGLSGSLQQRQDLKQAERALGKQSAKYMRDVTVAGGLPVLSTLRNLLNSGDQIRRIDGIFTVVLSYVLFRISPPPVASCSEFDQTFSKGAFGGDLVPSPHVPCSFSQAIKEAIALGLTEDDPLQDLENDYTARVLMVLARELGMDEKNEAEEIKRNSDTLFDSSLLSSGNNNGGGFFNVPDAVNQAVQARVDAAKQKGCVLRHISSIDVKEKQIDIQIVQVPQHHVFSISPPSCSCVRFFTKQHLTYPLVIQGPSAGADSTASALLAELLQRTRGGGSSTRSSSLGLNREGSTAFLRQEASVQRFAPREGVSSSLKRHSTLN